MTCVCSYIYCDGDHREVYAAQQGDIGTLEKLFDDSRTNDKHYHHYANKAAESDRLDVLMWMHSKGIDIGTWSFSTAIADENINILDWLYENGLCPTDTSDAWSEAIGRGSMTCVKWLHEHKCLAKHSVTEWAAWDNETECLKYLVKVGYPYDKYKCLELAKGGHTVHVKDNKIQYKNGYKYTVKYLRSLKGE